MGNNPALHKEEEESQWGDLPPQMKDLTEMMTPIVLEALRTGGRRGLIDQEIVERLVHDATRHQGAAPRNAPSPDTLQAVSRMLEELGDDVLPTLVSALRQPNDSEPPPEVKAMIIRLKEAFSLGETATAEDVLSRLRTGLGGNHRLFGKK